MPAPKPAPPQEAPPVIREIAWVIRWGFLWLSFPVLLALVVAMWWPREDLLNAWSGEWDSWWSAGQVTGLPATRLLTGAAASRDWITVSAASFPEPSPGRIDQAIGGQLHRIAVATVQALNHAVYWYLPLVVNRLMVFAAVLPALILSMVAVWWGSGVAANRLREAAGRFPQASVHRWWWRGAAWCWFLIPYGVILPVALGWWWLVLLAVLGSLTVFCLHHARAHWSTTGGV